MALTPDMQHAFARQDASIYATGNWVWLLDYRASFVEKGLLAENVHTKLWDYADVLD
jgi:hypothetical protein